MAAVMEPLSPLPSPDSEVGITGCWGRGGKEELGADRMGLLVSCLRPHPCQCGASVARWWGWTGLGKVLLTLGSWPPHLRPPSLCLWEGGHPLLQPKRQTPALWPFGQLESLGGERVCSLP